MSPRDQMTNHQAADALHDRVRMRLQQVLQEELHLDEATIETLEGSHVLNLRVHEGGIELELSGRPGPAVTYSWDRYEMANLQQGLEQHISRHGPEQVPQGTREFLRRQGRSEQPHYANLAPLGQHIPSYTRTLNTRGAHAAGAGAGTQDPDVEEANRWFQKAPAADSILTSLGNRKPRWADAGSDTGPNDPVFQKNLQEFLALVQTWAGRQENGKVDELVAKFAHRVSNTLSMYEIDRHLLVAQVRKLGSLVHGTHEALQQFEQPELLAYFDNWSKDLPKDESLVPVVSRVSWLLMALALGDLPGQTPRLTDDDTHAGTQQRQRVREIWQQFFSNEGQSPKTEFELFLRDNLASARFEVRAGVMQKLREATLADRMLIEYLYRCSLTAGVKFALVLHYLTTNDLQVIDNVESFFQLHPVAEGTDWVELLDRQLAKARMPGFGPLAHAWVTEHFDQGTPFGDNEQRLCLLVQALLHGTFPSQNAPLQPEMDGMPEGFLHSEQAHLGRAVVPEEILAEPLPELNQTAHPLAA